MSLTKIGSIGINTGIAFAGVTTITTLNGSDAVLSVGGTVNFNSDVSIGGSVSIGGTLTYEDVTNIDSVGLITARNGIVVGSGITLSKDGDVFFTGIITGNGSGLTNLATDLVNDTSPQLGGNLDVNTKNIVFGDSSGASDDRLTFGAGTDLSIYHNGSQSYVANGTGNLNISSGEAITLKTNTSEAAVICNNNGSVDLYHDDSKKLETTSYGALVTGNLKLGDSGIVALGDSDDLKLYHTAGTANYIQASGGHANIHLSNIHQLKNQANDAFMANFTNGASVQLYHNGTEKFSTQSYGIAVDGVLTVAKDSADDQTSALQVNGASMDSDGYNYLMSASNDSNANLLTMFINGSGRTSDGGANGLTLRNDNGPMSVGNNSTTHSTTYYTGLAGGIDFSGHGNVGGMNSELLDDYEEGTWTATLSDGETCTSAQTRYTKIGCLVTVNAYITNFSDFNGNNAGFRISGLPFAGRNVTSYHAGGSISYAHNFNYSYPLLPILAQGDTYIYFHRQDGTTATWKYQDFHNTGNGSGGQLIVNFTYESA